jgi:uncharacterized protein
MLAFSRKVSFIFLNIAILFAVNFALAESIDDIQAKNYINDYANIIDQPTEDLLNFKLYEYEASTTHQISVFTVNDLDGDYIEHYSIKLAEKVKLGTKKNDNGILLLISKNDRQMRIEVGYGLEAVVTDGVSSKIIKTALTPNFKNGEYSLGVKIATEDLMRIASGEVYVGDFMKESKMSIFLNFFAKYFIFIFFSVVILSQWLGSVLGRTKSWWLGGVLGAIVGGVVIFIFGAIILYFVIAFVLVLIGLLFDYLVSKNYKQSLASHTDPDWWSGGSWGPGSSGYSSSSRSGGWGGGSGGSFGGGGSSGSW